MQNIEDDILCIGCGYNLRHAQVEGKCPECGDVVSKSFDGRLRNADRAWLKKIFLGMTLMAAQQAAVAGNDLPVVVGTLIQKLWPSFRMPGHGLPGVVFSAIVWCCWWLEGGW